MWAVATIFSSGALFAATHPYSLSCVTFAFLLCLVLAYGFLARSPHGGKAFSKVVCSHGVKDFVGTIALALQLPELIHAKVAEYPDL